MLRYTPAANRMTKWVVFCTLLFTNYISACAWLMELWRWRIRFQFRLCYSILPTGFSFLLSPSPDLQKKRKENATNAQPQKEANVMEGGHQKSLCTHVVHEKPSKGWARSRVPAVCQGVGAPASLQGGSSGTRLVEFGRWRICFELHLYYFTLLPLVILFCSSPPPDLQRRRKKNAPNVLPGRGSHGTRGGRQKPCLAHLVRGKSPAGVGARA